jgi:hypothetical protein
VRSPAFSVGARVAGGVIALGYLSGMVAGPIVAVVGGLALMTLGRGLAMAAREEVIAGAALAVIASAFGVVALRWGALDLEALRGAQAVLGPTVLVGPTTQAVASWLAAGAALIALGLWLGPVVPRDGWTGLLWAAEALIGALAIVSVFWGPALTGGDVADIATGLGRWTAAVVVAGFVSLAIAVLARRLGREWRLGALAGAAASALAGVTLAATAS